ncbi:MAG TPA: hypothetical protein VN751_04235, partial [Solirubrobacteraceae bacterium]|nr:hypothetical protein [Solirubrobacteraceae bacterium]
MRAQLARAFERLPYAALAATAAAASVAPRPERPAIALLTFVAFIASAVALRRFARTAAHLPVLRV